MIEFKYDTAFSFLSQDEKIAYLINDLISDRVNTFIYSERQEELGGTDGEIAFGNVFGKESRTVTVLFRDGWGSSPWTRIEENAIRNRAFSEGWEFVTFILLDKNSKVPIYLPKTRLWIDFERWGLNGAASIIEQRIKEAGGDIRQETIDDRANRLKRSKKANLERQEYLKSQQSILDSNTEFINLFSEVKKLPQVLQDNESRLFFNTRDVPNKYFEFGYDGLFLRFKKTPQWSNKLIVCIYQKEGDEGLDYTETVFRKSEYLFDRSRTAELGWSENNQSRDFLTTKQLIDFWVKKYLDEFEKRKISNNI